MKRCIVFIKYLNKAAGRVIMISLVNTPNKKNSEETKK